MFALTTAFYLSPTGSIVFGLISDTVTGSSYAKFIQFENLIEKKYMGSYNGSALMDNALHMYVASLNDPYSSYFNKTNMKTFLQIWAEITEELALQLQMQTAEF